MVRLNDIVHFGLMLAALAAAYLVPFELLLLAYVVLGPAHYITEISWLHDRSYFLPHRGIAIALAVFAAIFTLIHDPAWFGFAVWAVLVGCAVLAGATTALGGMLIFIGAVAVTAMLLSSQSSLTVFGILVPTLVHVSLFTLVFMTLGAIRSASRVQAALVGAYLAAIVIILTLPPVAKAQIPSLAADSYRYFGGIPPALGQLIGIPDLKFDPRLTGLLAFAYTYHYLNWFIKVDIIRWADVPKLRLLLMIAASALATGLYFYNYTYGFIFLLALSLAHVLLEFPLNMIAAKQLSGAAATGLRSAFASAAPATAPRAKASRAGKRR